MVPATHGPASTLPLLGSKDLRLDDSAGPLLVVDYADRWPLSHLAWLFSDALFHKRIPTRVLMLARMAQPWPAVAELDKHLAAIAL